MAGQKQSKFKRGYDWYAFFQALWANATTWVNPKTKEEIVGGRAPRLSVILAAVWMNPSCWKSAFRGVRAWGTKAYQGVAVTDKDGNTVAELAFRGGACKGKLSKETKMAIKARWTNFFRGLYEIAEKVSEHQEFLESGQVQATDDDGNRLFEMVDFEEKVYNHDTKQFGIRAAQKKMAVLRPVEETDDIYRITLEELVLGKKYLADFPGLLVWGYNKFPDVTTTKGTKARETLTAEEQASNARNRAMAKRNAEFRIKMQQGTAPVEDDINLEGVDEEVEETGYSLAELRKAAGLEPLVPPAPPATPITAESQQTSEQVLQPQD